MMGEKKTQKIKIKNEKKWNKILNFFFFFEINILSCNETVDTDLIKGRNGDFFLTKKLSLIAIFQKKKFFWETLRPVLGQRFQSF